MLKRKFKIGSLELFSNIFCAPLAGCSDLPFRHMVKRFNPGLMFCEMVKMDALVRNDPGTLHILDYTSSMHPIGAQLCGSKLSLAQESARMIEDLGFDLLDFNCGCPVDKVTKDGSGSGMLKSPDMIGEMVSLFTSAVKIPVTVKIRAGWDEEHICVEEIAKIVYQAGASALCVHGRTRAQGYAGPANWEWIKRAKESAPSLLIIGNGDLFEAPTSKKMFNAANCDALLVARGTFGAPWIFEQIYAFLEKEEDPTQKQFCFIKEMLLDHLTMISLYQPEKKALLDLRRIGGWYLKNLPRAKSLREHLCRVGSLKEAFAYIHSFGSVLQEV